MVLLHSILLIISYVTLTTASVIAPHETSAIAEADRYRVIHMLTEFSMSRDPRVRDVTIPYIYMYNHVYQAYDQVDSSLSKVIKNGHNIMGVNFVLRASKIPNMYSPRPINSVLDFVMSCYKAKSGVAMDQLSVAILRGYQSDQVNKALIRSTTLTFKARSPGEKLFVWENKIKMDNFLRGLGYTRLACGGNQGVCDFGRLGVPETASSNLCLYSIDS